jgi:hypothetical protein
VIKRKELAICRQRGHSSVRDGWTQCKWCGIWLREVRKIEERENEPPEEELDGAVLCKRLLAQATIDINETKSAVDRIKRRTEDGQPPSKKPRGTK